MKTARTIFAVLTAFLLLPGNSLRAQFVRGHIYVSVAEPETCDFGGREWIVEIDPATGAWSVFADSDDGICVVSGLRFTPDGKKLLALNFGHYLKFLDGGWVQAFNPDGTSEIILDASDGLRSPSGANGLAFDQAGDLYVGSGDTLAILRYPGGAGPPTVYADGSDGISFQGALDFAPNGDLFYASHRTGTIVRITPEGNASLFDDPLVPRSLAFDRQGNLFVSAGEVGLGATIYRYDGADPSSRRVLASGFFTTRGALTLSLDETLVYYAEWPTGLLFTVDAQNGTTKPLADLTDLPEFLSSLAPTGITVYAPALKGDVDQDRDLDLRDFAAFANCQSGSNPAQLRLECLVLDIDGDDDVDLDDYKVFQPAITGP